MATRTIYIVYIASKLYGSANIQTMSSIPPICYMSADYKPSLQLSEWCQLVKQYIQACHWPHVHGINKYANKAEVDHNPAISLFYEDVRTHSTNRMILFF